MTTTSFVPNFGRMPVLGALPAALQLPVALLGQVNSVDAVVSDERVVYVCFKYHKEAQYTEALRCFRGVIPRYINIDKRHHCMTLTFACT
ncbi:hypothetical protein ACLI09_09520 [Flavobacterium sp. RHBU_24]|uniref:hypothetical protein n=1 Tax=Flavobacterium sp. RHBU_24 TaxID=3391185 RepID=UPI0039855D76